MAWMQVIRTRSCVLSGPTAASARCSIAQVKLGVVIRAGRNAGLATLHAHGDIDVVMYLDDDGTLPDTHAAEHVCDLFATTPTSASSASASPSGPNHPRAQAPGRWDACLDRRLHRRLAHPVRPAPPHPLAYCLADDAPRQATNHLGAAGIGKTMALGTAIDRLPRCIIGRSPPSCTTSEPARLPYMGWPGAMLQAPNGTR